MKNICFAGSLIVLASAGAAAEPRARLPDSAHNYFLDARISGNVASFRRGRRGTPRDLVHDPGRGDFAHSSKYHEYGVAFGADLGVVTEAAPVRWQAEWAGPVKANLIVLSGVYDNQPQPDTAWRIELRREGKWVTQAHGVGGWYDRGRYVWGGPGTRPISFDGFRVSVFSKDARTPLKSIHFRGEPGTSWIVTYCPPFDAELNLPKGRIRAGRPVMFRAGTRHGEISSWRWEFGDGGLANGPEVRHVFGKLGSYRVKLSFSDGRHTAFRTRVVTVMPPFRLRIRFRPTAAAVGEPIRFEAAVRDAELKRCEWDFGDGDAAQGKVVRHAFAASGVHRVSLRVSDGGLSDECATFVRVCARGAGKAAAGIPVWIDTDIGGDIDDAVCLLLAARHPRIEIVGVSTVRGCIGAVDAAAWLCREILRRSGRANVPVLPGAVANFSGEDAYPAGTGSYGELAPPPAPLSPAGDALRLKAVADTMRKVGKPFHLLTIGPLTNAAWLVKRRPDVVKQWLTVTCMAGQLTDEPECNVRLDPEAARIVCAALSPRLVGLEAIGPAIPRREAGAALDPADPASAFLLKCYSLYRAHATWSGYEKERRPLTVFDPTTLLSLVRPDAFGFRSVRLVVEKDGRFRLDDGGVPVTVAFSSDWDILKPLLLSHLRTGAAVRSIGRRQ